MAAWSALPVVTLTGSSSVSAQEGEGTDSLTAMTQHLVAGTQVSHTVARVLARHGIQLYRGGMRQLTAPPPLAMLSTPRHWTRARHLFTCQ
jgi:hypothetical protein